MAVTQRSLKYMDRHERQAGHDSRAALGRSWATESWVTPWPVIGWRWLQMRSARTAQGGRTLVVVLAYAALLLALGLVAQQAITWGSQHLDTLRYGFPRTTHLVAHVGHGDESLMPTMLQAQNLSGRISVLVMPGGDVSDMTVLQGPYLVGADAAYAVPHMQLADVNGDQHPDLLINVRGEVLAWVNDGGTFRYMSAQERALIAETFQQRAP